MLSPLLIYRVVYLHNNRWWPQLCMSALMSFIMVSTYVLYGCCVNKGNRWDKQYFPAALLWLMLRRDIKHRQTNTVENSDTVAVKEKFGGLGKKKTSSKHLWRTNTDAKDSHLCLQNHLLSLFVSVSLALTLIHCSVFTYAPFVQHKIQAWQLRTCRPFGKNICSAQCAEPRWEDLKQSETGALNKAPIWAEFRDWGGFFIVNIIFQACRPFAQ